MLNCYCQLSSSVIFRQYDVSQSECKIDRPRPGLPRLSPRPHTEALGTRLRILYILVPARRTFWYEMAQRKMDYNDLIFPLQCVLQTLNPLHLRT